MILQLSHRLDPHQPNWPGAPGLSIRRNHQMSEGDVADTHVVEIYTHYGTHCDVPSHFIPEGRTLSDFSVEDFVFVRPRLLELELGDDELVEPMHLAPYATLLADADLLLIRSGFESHRGDRTRYEQHGPGFSAAAAQYLRERAPSLRGVAMDWLSLCALAHVDEGVEAHRILLTDRDGHVVLIFEDVALSKLAGQPSRVLALPIFIDGLDGFPCTIIAEVD